MKHSSGFEKLCEEARSQVREITAGEVAARLDDASLLLIDVREDHEVAKGVIKNAFHLGRGIIERDIETKVPDKNHEIVLYCGGGYRSALAAVNLQKMGYTNVLSMAGGWRNWNEKSMPTQPSPSPI
jgi:rhodanese-related sulfurtransferase